MSQEIKLHAELFKTNIVGGSYLENTVSNAVNYIADAVSTSYGPHGSHSILLVNGQPKPTKDGLKIIEHMRMSNNIPQTILHMVHSIASSQNTENGDGSTTMTLLFRELYNKFKYLLANGNISPSQLKNNALDVVDIIIKLIDDAAHKNLTQDDMYAVIYTSVDGDKALADIIYKLFLELDVKNDPMVQLRYSDTKEHHYELIDGITIDANLIMPELVLNYANQKNIDSPSIVLIDGQMKLSVPKFMNLAEALYQSNLDAARVGQPQNILLFICSGITEELFSIMSTVSKSNPELFSGLGFLQYKHLTKRDYIKDLSVLLNCTITSEDFFKNYDKDDLTLISDIIKIAGTSEKVVIREYSSQFTGLLNNSAGDLVSSRVKEIEETIKKLEQDPGSVNTTIEELEERMSMLRKNCAVLYVGGASIERKNINFELARDAVPQVMSAYKHGVLDGMNKGIFNILKSYIESDECVGLSQMQQDIIHAIIHSYIDITILILKNKYPKKNRDELYDEALSILNGLSPNNIRGLSDISVLGSANTDKVVIKNAVDMAVLLTTAKLVLTTAGDHDLMQLS